MFIYYLVPLAILILPIVAIVMVNRQSGRLKNLEKTVNELKGKLQNVGGNVQSVPVQSNQVSSGQTFYQAPQQVVNQNIGQAQPNNVPKPQVSKTNDALVSEDSSGKILGRLGIAAVLIGVAFFLKYAFDNNWIGETGRVMIGIIIGIGFLGLGQYIRAKYLQYSDLLMGGGISVLYLSIFSAHTFYNLIDSPTTAVIMFVITLLAFAISVYNATQTLALVSVIGAFATPFLVNSHDNSMITLFGYMTIINLGVLGISFFKKWPRLNLASLVGTAINFITWYGFYYTSSELAPVLVFCVITFLIFLIAQVSREITAGIKADEADYILIGMNAFAFATMLYVLLDPEYHGVLGLVSVVVALVYMGISYLVNKTNPQDRALNIFLPGIAVVFLSIAVPLQFSGAWIAAAWFVEACFLYGVASVISNRGFQVMGLVVYILGLFDFTIWYYGLPQDIYFVPIFNTAFAMFVLAILTAYIIAYIYKRFGSLSAEIQKRGILAFVIIANILSIWGMSVQVTSYYSAQNASLTKNHYAESQNIPRFSNGYDASSQIDQENQDYFNKISSNGNISNTLVSILWTLYAAVLTGFGFVRRTVSMRRFGLILFLVTAFKVLIDVWNLGELYRIISFIGFGVIALAASFGYVKYRDRLKQILSLALLIGASTLTGIGLSGDGVNQAHAAFKLSDWQYVRSVNIDNARLNQSTSDFVKLKLPSDISWNSRNYQEFSDLRIIDGNSFEVPFVLDRDRTASSPILNARLINVSFTKSNSTEFAADLGSSNIVYTNLQFGIDQTVRNFRRQVSIYSADSLLPMNSKDWSLITNNGFIFRITDPSTGSVSGKYEIDVKPTTSRYLKIVIGAGEEGPVDVNTLSAQSDVQVSQTTDNTSFNSTSFNNPQKKTTEITVDLGIVGRLSKEAILSIDSSNSNYIRQVAIESSNDMKNWNYVGNASISRINTTIFRNSSDIVTYPEQKARYLRFSIINNDNPPLSVGNTVNVITSVLTMIFQVDKGKTYSVYYGNPNAQHPEYDTALLSNYIDKNNLSVVTVGPQLENPAYIAPLPPVIPFTESHKSILNIFLVFLVIIIGGGVGWYLRNYIRTKGGDGGWPNKS